MFFIIINIWININSSNQGSEWKTHIARTGDLTLSKGSKLHHIGWGGFCLFVLWPHPVAYGSFQARGWIRAAAGTYATATARATTDPSHIWNLQHSLKQCWILTHWARLGIEPAPSRTLCWVLNPLRRNGNSTCVLIYRRLKGFFFFCFFFFFFFIDTSCPYWSFQTRGRIQAAVGSLNHSPRNTKSEPHLQPTPQLTTSLDP